MSSGRETLGTSQRWVIKIGSALLTDDGKGLDRSAMAAWVRQIAALLEQGKEVVLVSSGAVAEGMTRLGWQQRPDSVHELQAAAAVGQMGLVQSWEAAFQAYDRHTAQVLLVHEDLSDRERYLNARSTLQTLLSLGVVPVVNENDTVATDEIRFGDNDTLGGVVANLIDADVLVILTDQNGLYKQDPRKNPDAELIGEAQAGDVALDGFAAGGAGELGRGGMLTKLKAARVAARSGADTVIAGGRNDGILRAIASGQPCGTWLKSGQQPVAARKPVAGQPPPDPGSVASGRGRLRQIASIG